MAGDEFSELLGRLKERSGLSYGVLGKRLHMSASTLHRYVNGDAVPTDYAPVERFARVCKATPEELVELHRRWILADALRGQKAVKAPAEEAPPVRTAGAVPGTVGSDEAAAVAEAAPGSGTAAGTVGSEATARSEATATAGFEAAAVTGSGTAAGSETATGPEATDADADVPEVQRASPAGTPPVRRRRTVVLAATAVVAAVAAAALVVNLVPDKGPDDRSGKQSAGAAAESVGSSPHASEPADAKGGSASPSMSASRSGSPAASGSAPAAPARSGESQAADNGSGSGSGDSSQDGATAPTVAVNPYKWENQCSQHYLVDQQPEQVPPPPAEPDARGWVSALGGVAAGQQMLALTVQGTGKATVVLEALHVRVAGKSAPLAWNDFAMGVGCGGGVGTTSFGVDLDAGRPALSPRAGQRDFPYKVSESDPEVFYIFADARASNVSWYLELDWSSGDRHGTVRLDDKGKPFRTSGNAGRPAYTYPPGYSEWGRDESSPEIPG
ncbi:transcriptional regulator [Streptomyces odonnellii]|uniref:transcriptional regulator n=1 Tax=Streptomyces odonnellii TaxID=1417980 RepID=UPI00062545A0|nr:helix-turn-helix transcriptional regulator [Streptomyces odonnellii]